MEKVYALVTAASVHTPRPVFLANWRINPRLDLTTADRAYAMTFETIHGANRVKREVPAVGQNFVAAKLMPDRLVPVRRCIRRPRSVTRRPPQPIQQ